MRLLKEMFIIFLAVFAALYLINPTAGFLELLPDNIPGIGNLDEGVATLILINTLNYYGIDLTNLYRRGGKPRRRRQLPPPSDET